MAWHQLEVSLRSEDLPRAETLLKLAGAEAFSICDAAHTNILEPNPGTTPLWPDVVVKALYQSASTAAAGSSVLAGVVTDSASIQIRQLDETEWLDTWAQRPTRQLVGERLAITAADEDCRIASRVPVRLNLGLAFGTGDHPTTALCLEWLDRYLAPGARVLDYGCGSGVLAIAALCLGASSAWAVDIDPQALSATRENAELNRVPTRLWVGTADNLPVTEVDVVVANILAQPLCDLAGLLRDLVTPGGHIVLSGILTHQSEAVKQAYAGNFGPFEETQRDGWACLAAPRH